jgi:hypothetical protein
LENKMATFEGASSPAPPSVQEREGGRQFVEALQAVEFLLQDPISAVFVARRPLKQFKRFEALVDSFPFQSEAPPGFHGWWESSEAKRQEWLEQVKRKHAVPRPAYFVLSNFPLKKLGSDTYVGSVFLVLASKDEKGRIRFVKAASGFLVPGTMANTFRHSPDSLGNPDPKRAA